VKDAATLAAEARQAKLDRIAELLRKVREKEETELKQQQEAMQAELETEAKDTAATAAATAGAAGAGGGVDDVEAELMRVMGLPVSGFSSTKGKPVPDGNVSGAKVQSQRKFRQYMNKNKGGQRTPLTQQQQHTSISATQRAAPQSRQR
jgi:hypothetical protein